MLSASNSLRGFPVEFFTHRQGALLLLLIEPIPATARHRGLSTRTGTPRAPRQGSRAQLSGSERRAGLPLRFPPLGVEVCRPPRRPPAVSAGGRVGDYAQGRAHRKRRKLGRRAKSAECASMWPRNTWFRARACRVCYQPAWRACRVCGWWVCRNHRHGYGNWWRCERCPAAELVALMRAEHDELRAEAAAAREARARAELAARLARSWPIGSLGGLPAGRGSTAGAAPVLR